MILREASPAARSAANGVLSGAKVRVKNHACAHIRREVSAAPANSGTAVLMVMRFSRQSFAVMPNSVTKKSQISSGRFFQLKRTSVQHLDPIGIDVHIGSQIVKPEPYVKAIDRVLELIDELSAEGIELSYLDIGGGYGISYDDKPGMDVAALARDIVPKVKVMI